MTHTAKHTPGPWIVGCERVGRQTTHYITIQKSSIYFNRGVGQTEDEMRANAHLIAAAPAMYEALSRLRNVASTASNHMRLSGNEEEALLFDNDQRVVEAALAQADGKQ